MRMGRPRESETFDHELLVVMVEVIGTEIIEDYEGFDSSRLISSAPVRERSDLRAENGKIWVFGFAGRRKSVRHLK